MSIADVFVPEFDHECRTTRSLIERVPETKADWKPHAKSTPLGNLTIHLCNLAKWGEITMLQTEFDLNPPGGQQWRPPQFTTTAKALEFFDDNVARARAEIARASDEAMREPWSLKNGGNVIFTLPRAGVLRSFVMSHSIHHRGQLSVYLRLLDVPLPSIYGPSADTQ